MLHVESDFKNDTIESKVIKPLKTENGQTDYEVLVCKFVFPSYFEEKHYLPKGICLTCRQKLKNHDSIEEYPVYVDFVGLVKNVKKSLSESNLSENLSCPCEICKISTSTVLNNKSLFVCPTNIGRPSLEKKPRITDFFGETKDSTKEEKINEILDFTCPESLEQLCSAYLKKKARETKHSQVSLKNLNGSPLKVNLGLIRFFWVNYICFGNLYILEILRLFYLSLQNFLSMFS